MGGEGKVEPVRLRTVDFMLLGTVLLWALNSTVTRYVLTHGFQPLAYATIRYARGDRALLALHVPRVRGRSGSPAATFATSRSPPW